MIGILLCFDILLTVHNIYAPRVVRSFSLLLTVVCDTTHFGKEAPFQRNFLSLSLVSNPEGEVTGFFKMLVPMCWTTCIEHHSSQDINLQSHHCENLKLFPLMFPHLYGLSKIQYGSRIWRFSTANTVMSDPFWGVKGRNHTILGKTALCKLLIGKIRLRSAIFWDNLSVHSSRVKKSKSLVLKTKCQPEDKIRYVNTCSSVTLIEFSCVWKDTDLICFINNTMGRHTFKNLRYSHTPFSYCSHMFLNNVLRFRTSLIYYFYRCTVHLEDSLSITYKQMH